ncbi:MAG: glycosyltransferase [Blastochloris sp.]|nr:glycosyltransferase [Blastochloris sp.]
MLSNFLQNAATLVLEIKQKIDMTPARILILTNGPLSRNPRVVKEATTLGFAGYHVTVLGIRNHALSASSDLDIAATAPFTHQEVNLLDDPTAKFPQRLQVWFRRIRIRLARELSPLFPSIHVLGPAADLLRAAQSLPSDLVIVHNEIPHWIGTRLLAEGRRVAVDFEDWHSEDLIPQERAGRPLELLRRCEHTLLHHAASTSTTSNALADGLHRRHGGTRPHVITNSFPLSALSEIRTSLNRPPTFFWFSQTTGPGRGLELFLRAWAGTTQPSNVVLLGNLRRGYDRSLLDLLPLTHRSRLQFLPLVSPTELPALIAQHDIGLALEESFILNRDLTITNKILQYLNAGLAIIASDTAGQREVLAHNPAAGIIVSLEDTTALAATLDQLLADPAALLGRRHAARRLAEEHYCWEREAPKLLANTQQCLARPWPLEPSTNNKAKRICISHPSVATSIQQSVQAFHEVGALDQFITTLTYQPDHWLQKLFISSGKLFAYDVNSQFKRRLVHEIPFNKIRNFPCGEILRLASTRIEPSGRLGDWVWFQTETGFDRKVARTLHKNLKAVYGFENCCLTTFKRATTLGLPKIYEVLAPELGFVQAALEKQVQTFPELRTPFYEFTRLRALERIKRKHDEWNLADRIICASRFSRDTYAHAGLDVEKVRIVPYGAPIPCPREQVLNGGSSPDKPLNLIWVGTFGLRKGAHLVLEAWRQGALGRHAVLHVFGKKELPLSLTFPTPQGIHFHGTLPHEVLMKKYQEADALLFPTLCDGFGLVASEAWSRGVPVITTNQAGASEQLQSGKNGILIQADSAQAIHDVVVWCHAHRQDLRTMRGAAWQTASAWQWSDYRKALRMAVADLVPHET